MIPFPETYRWCQEMWWHDAVWTFNAMSSRFLTSSVSSSVHPAWIFTFSAFLYVKQSYQNERLLTAWPVCKRLPDKASQDLYIFFGREWGFEANQQVILWFLTDCSVWVQYNLFSRCTLTYTTEIGVGVSRCIAHSIKLDDIWRWLQKTHLDKFLGKEKNNSSSSDHQTGCALRNQNAFIYFFSVVCLFVCLFFVLFFLQSKWDFSVSPSAVE